MAAVETREHSAARPGDNATDGASAPPVVESVRPQGLSWQALPFAAQVYVALVVLGGALTFANMFPLSWPRPVLFAVLVVVACLTAAWKVNLPLPLSSGSTLSVSYAAKLMALLLLGPGHAVLVAVAAAATQCTYKVRQRYPLYRTVFSMAAEALTMAATAVVFGWLGGSSAPLEIALLAKPLVGAIAAYFLVNTGLVAAAIALSSGRRLLDVWQHDFLWSAVTVMVAGTAGAMAAIVVDRGHHWVAALLVGPLYVTYRTYQLFVVRLEDHERHMNTMRRMHQETVDALQQAHQAEQALGEEKERLAAMLAEMTRLEEAQNELLEREQSARASAEQANRLKDQFLAIVSHELRTPLNAILGWSDMLRGGKIDESRRERAFQLIHDSATRQAQLIEDLLDVSRIMSGKLRLERTFVCIEEVIREALSVVQSSADAKQVRIGLDIDRSAGLIYADRARVQQITWNLLSNAIKFTSEGGGVNVAVARSGGDVEMVVTDTGQGIPPEFLPSVFEPFRQADGSTTRRHGGLGLGLSIVKSLVEAHGGAVSAHSAGEGLGATFTVRLPAVAESEHEVDPSAARRSGSRTASVPPASLAGLSVLVVDDDDQGRQVVTAQLELHQATVRTAASTAAALEVLRRERVDVLLADIAMPGEDGYSLIRQLRALEPAEVASVPAAALTAFARNEDRLRALDAGFQLHLAKPIDAGTLVNAVARLGGKLRDRRHAARPLPAESPLIH
jgi:signal transduction histidine kinase/ActR/RegA family two-component response regulator